MSTHFLRSAAELMVYTSHKRGAHALGGMSTYIPRKDDSEANHSALAQVRADKEQEASQGYDGAWVAHPALVPLVSEVFRQAFTGPNQLSLLPETKITAEDLLLVPKGEVTEEGVRENISASLQYLDAWMQGTGAVAIFGRMEDTATAEIARSQLWQWMHYGALLPDRRKVDVDLWEQVCAEEVDKLLDSRDAEDPKSLDKAIGLLDELINSPTFTEFLTIPGYRSLE
jgi:malate synthase